MEAVFLFGQGLLSKPDPVSPWHNTSASSQCSLFCLPMVGLGKHTYTHAHTPHLYSHDADGRCKTCMFFMKRGPGAQGWHAVEAHISNGLSVFLCLGVVQTAGSWGQGGLRTRLLLGFSLSKVSEVRWVNSWGAFQCWCSLVPWWGVPLG